MIVCVFGASSADLEDIYYNKAYELGETLSLKGHSIIFGGGDKGLMGSVARGASDNDGYIISIAPRFFDKPGILFKECSEYIYTDTMNERKKLMEDKADAFIALPGGIGTYEELLEVMTLKQLGQLDKPIAIYNVNGYYAEFEKMMESTVKKGFMRNDANVYEMHSNLKELITYIERK